MRLRYHAVSPYARKALVALRHRGDDVELHLLNIMAGELKSPEFQALSPFGKMPALETPEGPIIESTSIIEYVEERGPLVLLQPDTARLARHFDRIGDNYLIDTQTTIWFKPGTPEAKKARETAITAWEILDKALENKAYLTGERFTMGDIGAAIGTDYLHRLGLVPPKRVADWMTRCFQIPAMATSHEEALPMVLAMLEQRAQKIAAMGE